MLESLGALTSSPWIYVVVAVSVLLDVFLPLLPSGVLVITAATAAAAGSTGVNGSGNATGEVPSLVVLILCAATASVLGDLVAYRLAWRGGDRLDRAIARSRRLTKAQERLGAALSRGGGALVIIARFAPAGRSVVSLGAGAAHRRKRDFLPWSAVAGLAWAGYSVGLGYFGGRWLGSTWFGTAVSVLALFMAGALAAFVVKRPAAERAAAAATAEPPEDASVPAAVPGPVAGSRTAHQDSAQESVLGLTSSTASGAASSTASSTASGAASGTVPSQPHGPAPVTSPAPVTP